MFLPNQRIRKLLRTYASQTDTLRNEQYQEMLALLETSCKPLKEFILENDEGYGGAHETLADLFHSLASESAMSTIVPPTGEAGNLIHDLCDDMDVRKDPAKWKEVQETMPILFQLFSVCDSALPIDQSFKDLLKV